MQSTPSYDSMLLTGADSSATDNTGNSNDLTWWSVRSPARGGMPNFAYARTEDTGDGGSADHSVTESDSPRGRCSSEPDDSLFAISRGASLEDLDTLRHSEEDHSDKAGGAVLTERKKVVPSADGSDRSQEEDGCRLGPSNSAAEAKVSAAPKVADTSHDSCDHNSTQLTHAERSSSSQNFFSNLLESILYALIWLHDEYYLLIQLVCSPLCRVIPRSIDVGKPFFDCLALVAGEDFVVENFFTGELTEEALDELDDSNEDYKGEKTRDYLALVQNPANRHITVGAVTESLGEINGRSVLVLFVRYYLQHAQALQHL